MELNLHHLRIFNTLTKEKTTYNAAKALRISQPSVSSQIKQLEKTIGIPLFEKKGRNIVLTEFGEKLSFYVEKLFEIENDIVHEIHQLKNKSTLHISGHQMSVKKILNPMIESFKSFNQGTEINISIKSTQESINLLNKGDIDLGIIGVNPNLNFELDEKEYSKIHLMNDHFCFVVNTNFNIPTSISKNELINLPLIGRLENSYSQDLLDNFFEKQLHFKIRFENASSALEYTLSNNIIYFVSYSLVHEYIEQSLLKKIEIYDIDDSLYKHDIYAVFKNKNKSKILIKQFLGQK